MSEISRMKLVKLLCLFWLSWSCAAGALSLGSPKLLSKSGEPLKVEFPIRVGADEQATLSTLNAVITNKASYERLGISKKVIDLNPRATIYRNQEQQLMVLVETGESVFITDDPFIDVLLTLNWSAGSLTKAYTLLIGDTGKILVRQGQTLSEIAAQLAQRIDGASLDQTMLALFKANPDAFASGSINRLEAGVELNRPNQALLRSISPAEAQQFVAESNAQWQSERESKILSSTNASATRAGLDLPAKDRLKIGSSTENGPEERRYTEELVAQEKILEQTRTRIAELEKNIADLQHLLDQSKIRDKGQIARDDNFGLGGFAPALLALVLMVSTGLLLWLLAKNARTSEEHVFSKEKTNSVPSKKNYSASHGAIPERAKALFASIDLNLNTNKESSEEASAKSVASDVLRVKLNLARAYITIEDFAAAKKSLQEIILAEKSIDPATTSAARELLLEISQRNS